MPSPPLPRRKSPRLPLFDYSQTGVYFVTICTHQRDYFFGNITNNTMKFSAVGQIAYKQWGKLSAHFKQVTIPVFVVMPNHVHGLISIDEQPRINHRPALGTIVGSYKAAVTRQVNRELDNPPATLWQARFHDHIIRNEEDFKKIYDYIQTNPLRWEQDVFNG